MTTIDSDITDRDQRRFTEAQARVGQMLRGKWTLDRLLGMGGMSAVYAATHRNGMRGAVKLLDREYSLNTILVERFLREGYIANKLSDVGAVRVLDDDVTECGSVFLVMELLEGQALDELAMNRGGKLSVREVLELCAQLLRTLTAAHALGIVHRDIKPENLFLTTQGELKVLDFGLARIRENDLGISNTQSGCVMGTPAYMSPEQARGRWDLVDAQSDLWSVGSSMFWLLSGEYLHGAEGTVSELVAATFTKPPRSLRTVLPNAPDCVIELVDRALRLDKADRWLDASTMMDALDEVHVSLFQKSVGNISARALPAVKHAPSDGLFSFTQSNRLAPTQSIPMPLSEKKVSDKKPFFARKAARLQFAGATAALLVLGLAFGGSLPMASLQASTNNLRSATLRTAAASHRVASRLAMETSTPVTKVSSPRATRVDVARVEANDIAHPAPVQKKTDSGKPSPAPARDTRFGKPGPQPSVALAMADPPESLGSIAGAVDGAAAAANKAKHSPKHDIFDRRH